MTADPERQRVAARRPAAPSWRSCSPCLVPVLRHRARPRASAAVVILLVGSNPLEAYGRCSRGMFGTPDRHQRRRWPAPRPFIGAALAVAFAFRAGLFNIGAEGQLLVGATLAAWVGTFSFLADVPGSLADPDRHPRRRAGGAAVGRHPRRA